MNAKLAMTLRKWRIGLPRSSKKMNYSAFFVSAIGQNYGLSRHIAVNEQRSLVR
jgi:hypothetical protein